MLTKKNYIAIAEIYNKNYSNKYALPDLLFDLCKYFKQDNPNFNTDKFIEACYKESS